MFITLMPCCYCLVLITINYYYYYKICLGYYYIQSHFLIVKTEQQKQANRMFCKIYSKNVKNIKAN